MPLKTVITQKQLSPMIVDMADRLTANTTNQVNVWGVPRGGVPIALALAMHPEINLVSDPINADFIVDDLIDSGATKHKYMNRYPNSQFRVLIDKRQDEWKNTWIIFPWEVSEEGNDTSIEDVCVRLLQYVGEDPNREGLQDTPARFAKAWSFWTSGYGKDPAEVMKVFEDGGEKCDEMVTVKNIPIYSHCEHHLAAILGTVTISYIPNKKIIGLSKLSRLADMFARRLQVQERLTDQIADALFEGLAPKGVGVRIEARHMCMESRGISQQGHYTVTTSLRGVIKEGEPRAEFLSLCDK